MYAEVLRETRTDVRNLLRNASKQEGLIAGETNRCVIKQSRVKCYWWSLATGYMGGHYKMLATSLYV